jgi:hypothetical protein
VTSTGGLADGVKQSVVMHVTGVSATASASFEMLAGEVMLPLRVLTDARSVEIFAGNGRAIFSGALSYTFCKTVRCPVQITAASGSGASVSGAAWEMDSIF